MFNVNIKMAAVDIFLLSPPSFETSENVSHIPEIPFKLQLFVNDIHAFMHAHIPIFRFWCSWASKKGINLFSFRIFLFSVDCCFIEWNFIRMICLILSFTKKTFYVYPHEFMDFVTCLSFDFFFVQTFPICCLYS